MPAAAQGGSASCLAAMLTVAAGADTPAPAPLHIIGGQAAGCIAGAVRLPARGRDSRPSTCRGVPSGARLRPSRASDAWASRCVRPDWAISTSRTSRGHAAGRCRAGICSHQLGLDVDVGLDVTPKRALTAAERETVELPSMVRPDQRGVASPLDGRSRSRCCIWPRACRRWTAS